MPRRVRQEVEAFRLDIGDGDWVDLKKGWTVYDRQVIEDALYTMQINMTQKVVQPRNGFRPGKEPRKKEGPTVNVEQSMHVYAANIAALKRGIVAWGGPGFCVIDHGSVGTEADHQEGLGNCKPIPVNDANIMALDYVTSQAITQALNEANPVVPPKKESDDEDEDEEGESPLLLNAGQN